MPTHWPLLWLVRLVFLPLEGKGGDGVIKAWKTVQPLEQIHKLKLK
jgi:hypothetical protein